MLEVGSADGTVLGKRDGRMLYCSVGLVVGDSSVSGHGLSQLWKQASLADRASSRPGVEHLLLGRFATQLQSFSFSLCMPTHEVSSTHCPLPEFVSTEHPLPNSCVCLNHPLALSEGTRAKVIPSNEAEYPYPDVRPSP